MTAVADGGWDEEPVGVEMETRDEMGPAVVVRVGAGDDWVVQPGGEAAEPHEVMPADDVAKAVPEVTCDGAEVVPGDEAGPDDAGAVVACEVEEAGDAAVTEAGDAAVTGVGDVSAVGSVVFRLQICDVPWSNHCHL